MPFKKLFHMYERSIMLVSIIGFALLGFVIGIVPLIKKTAAMQNRMSVLQKEIIVLQNKQSILASLDEETLRGNLHDLSAAVPPEKSPSTVLSTIDGVISQSGAVVQSIQIQRPGSIATDSAKKLSVQESKIGTFILPFNVTVSGSIDSVRSFLTTIVSVRRLIRLHSLSMTFTNESEVRLDGEAFYMPYPATIASVSTPVTPLSESELNAIAAVTSLPLAYTETQVVGAQTILPAGKEDPFSR